MPKRDESYMADRRDAILDATVRCLLRTGLAGLSTSAICKEADISMGALYTHFATKEDIILGIAARSTSRRRERLAVNSPATLRDQIVQMVAEARKPRAKNAVRVDLELICAGSTNEAIAKSFKLFRDSRDLALTLQALKEAGGLRPEIDPEVAACAIDGMVHGFQLMTAMGPRYERSYEAAINMLLDKVFIPSDPADRGAEKPKTTAAN